MVILKFSSVDEVVKRCNASICGLSAGVCTRDVGKALKVAEQLRAGTVWVSTCTTLCLNVTAMAAYVTLKYSTCTHKMFGK